MENKELKIAFYDACSMTRNLFQKKTRTFYSILIFLTFI